MVETGINIPAILIANLMGVVVLSVAIISNSWQLRSRRAESRALSWMIVFAISCCIVDPICFLCDGRPGLACFLAVYLGNTFLFGITFLIGPQWVILVSDHVGVPLRHRHKLFMRVVAVLALVPLVVNVFEPVVFSVGADNAYHRGPLFWVYMAMEIAFVVDGVVCYLHARRHGGILKFFPVLAFLIPAMCGIAIQSLVYGVSTIWPFFALSISCIMTSLANEKAFRDGLTGLYNRLYLDNLSSRMRGDYLATIMLLDLNAFKFINDDLGHSVGDQALIETARILRSTVGSLGEVVRYAGDEFFIVVNTQDDEKLENLVFRIRSAFAHFNAKGAAPYELSIALGYAKVNMREQRIDSMFDIVDALMYEDKDAFYEANPQLNRRRQFPHGFQEAEDGQEHQEPKEPKEPKESKEPKD